jgi:S-adenosylmethionine uptake transporter
VKTLLQAVAVMSFGKLLFAVQDVIIKEMSGAYPIHEIVTIRGLVAIPILLALIHFTVKIRSLRHHRPGYHLLRGLLMFMAFMAYYVALSEMSLTTATALFFTAPFFITLLSIPMLGESVGPRRIITILIGFCGVVIVIRPDSSSFDLITLLPILSAFFYALCQLMVRYAKMTAPASIMSIYLSLCFIIFGLLSALVFQFVDPPDSTRAAALTLYLPWVIPHQADLLAIAFTGVSSGLGFMFASYAYQQAQASRLAPFEYVMIIWVTILSFLVWDELPDTQTVIGLIIIISSGLYVLHREDKADKKPDNYLGLGRR